MHVQKVSVRQRTVLVRVSADIDALVTEDLVVKP